MAEDENPYCILALVKLHPQAASLVLANGLPVVVEVSGESMTPTIERGTKVRVEPVTDNLYPGDIVLILNSNEGELVLHRVMHLFEERGRQFIIHQGDALRAAFSTCPRQAVVGRAAGFPLTPERALPTLEVLDRAALRRFQRRRHISRLYSLVRRTTYRFRNSDRSLARMCRGLAGKVIG